MPKVHHVKRARKYNPKAKVRKGMEYFWWGTIVKGRFVKRYSKTRPKRSQLTNSVFWKTIHQLRERVEESSVNDGAEFNTLRNEVTDRLEELNEELFRRRDNLPDGFKRGRSGEMFTERMEAVSAAMADMPDEFEEGFVTPTEVEASMRALKSALEGVACE